MRVMDTEKHLFHDLFNNSILIDFSSTTTKTNKSLIVTEIEIGLLLATAVSI